MSDPHPILPAEGFNELATCRDGVMLFNRHDQYVGTSLRKYGELSHGESGLFHQIVGPGSTVVEVGANIGAHTVGLSRLVGPKGVVVAYEPQRIVFQTLCANLALNSCANVYAFWAAIGEAPGEISVPFVPPDQPANFGGLSLLHATQGERVPLHTIDMIGLNTCHFLKLDLEGMEVEALKGGARTIATHRPIIYVENDRKERSAELISLLLSWKYRLFGHWPPLFTPDNFRNDQENIFGNLVSINVLCVPAEASLTIQGFTEITAP